MNLVHWLLPIFTVKRRVDKLDGEYKDVLDYYTAKPSELVGQKSQTFFKAEA